MPNTAYTIIHRIKSVTLHVYQQLNMRYIHKVIAFINATGTCKKENNFSLEEYFAKHIKQYAFYPVNQYKTSDYLV